MSRTSLDCNRGRFGNLAETPKLQRLIENWWTRLPPLVNSATYRWPPKACYLIDNPGGVTVDADVGDNEKSYEPDSITVSSDSTPEARAFTGQETSDRESVSAFDSLFSFFLLSEEGLDVLSRIMGLLSVYSCFEIFKRLNWLREEYQVESWWWRDQCLSLPDSETLAIILLCICAITGIAMAFGVKGKIAPAVVALCVGYLTCLDVNIAFPHSFFLTIWVCVALLFRRAGKSVTRRLIQLALFACYSLSALQKVFTPQFIQGHSLAALKYGPNLDTWVLKVVSQLPSSSELWQLVAIFVVVVELALALGLWHSKSRKFALIGIIVFQSLILLTMDPRILPLHLMICLCCLSFVNPIAIERRFGWLLKRVEAPACSALASEVPDYTPPGVVYKTLTILATAILFAIPLRIYFYPNAFEQMSMMDRRPWTFCMFVCLEGRYKTSIVLKRKDGDLVWVKPRGRMAYLSSDSDLLALAKYLEKTYPGVLEIKIESQYDVNMTNTDHKVLTAKAAQSGNFLHHISWRREPIGN